MKVKNWMTSNPITVKPNTPVMEASRLMKEHGIRRLPVVKGDKVVGIVTQRNLLEAAPSAATTLSVHELNYILANLEVSQVMRKNPVCVSPDDSVIDVMIMGQEKGIGSFPVVDNGRLVGIATETEIFRAMMHLFGGKEKGDDFVVLANVRLRERVGAMSRISSIIEGLDVPVISMFSLPHRRSEGNRLYIRVHTGKLDEVKAALAEAGYNLDE
jgi:acetoin utilization protein AcuB